MTTNILHIPCNTIDGREIRLADLEGKAFLIVNTASKCGFTPQYKGLEQTVEDLRRARLRVVGFPCNQFGGQEPGNAEEISEFCELNFGVSFPLFSKVDVNGDDAHPLFVELKQQAPGVLGSKKIKWNFTKFLVDASGEKVTRYAPTTSPDDLTADIEKLLS